MMDTVMKGMFGPIAPGQCKLSIKGEIAVKTTNGYKTFNPKTKRLVNCQNFAFDADGMFFVVPTNSLKKGDIIIAGGKPRAVLEVADNEIKTFCYETSEITTIVPEHHIFMGKQYFYGKIVSLVGNMMKNGSGNMMKMMMLSKMMGGANPFGAMFGGDTSNSSMNSMLPMMMLMGGKDDFMGGMLEGLFDDGIEVTDDEEEDE